MSGEYAQLFGYCFTLFTIGYIGSYKLLIFKKGFREAIS